jgi:hypothetical protein
LIERKLTTREALQDLQDVLYAVSSSSSLQRDFAVRYMHARAAVMERDLRPAVPGFLVQCISIGKFHDFITLYHPRVENRLSFIDEALADCWALLDSRRAYDVFGDSEF